MTVWTKLMADTLILPPATQYGYMIDYLYAVNHFNEDGEMGSNIARRNSWPAGVCLYARAFTEEEIDPAIRLPHGVFLTWHDVREEEYSPSEVDMQATDWMIGTRI